MYVMEARLNAVNTAVNITQAYPESGLVYRPIFFFIMNAFRISNTLLIFFIQLIENYTQNMGMIIGEFCVCKQTPLCLSYVISHGCLLRLVSIERNTFLLLLCTVKYIISKRKAILTIIPCICMTS